MTLCKIMAEAQANSSFGGYDEDFVDVVEDEWNCPICQLPLKEAVQTGVCGHRFCRQCLDGHFMRQEQDLQQLSCPVDRNNLVREKDIFPDKATQRKILSFTIKCPIEGCQWTGELRSKDDHLESCPLKVVSCTNQNCHVSIARKDLREHVTTTCQWRIISCTHCNAAHPACEIKGEHTWKMSGLYERMIRAKTSKDIKIESAPFYTSACGRCGYKFKIRFCLERDIAPFFLWFSVYFVIMKGEYDSILPWPFRRKVALTLIDQQKDLNDRKNIVMSITPDPTNDGEWNKRPVTVENTGRKCGSSLLSSTLGIRRFIVDDTIVLQVTIPPLEEV